MASTVKPSQRAFALTIAIIFLVTTLATSVLVVMAIIDDSKNKNADVTSQTTTDPAAATADADTCTTDSIDGYPAAKAPEVYKAPGAVAALETTTVEAGTGEVVKAGDCLVAKYYGTYAQNGEKFDENYSLDKGLVFKLGAGAVIPGWDQGVVGMKVGETRRLVIPYALAYGEAGRDPIPPKADLVFTMKVLEIKK